MQEQKIEQKLVRAVQGMGGICPKLVCPGYSGMPDRIALLPGGKLAFIEVKAPGKEPRPLQLSRHAMLRRLGYRVYVMDDVTQIGGTLDGISAT